jgi:hypothetical protein
LVRFTLRSSPSPTALSAPPQSVCVLSPRWFYSASLFLILDQRFFYASLIRVRPAAGIVRMRRSSCFRAPKVLRAGAVAGETESLRLAQ